MDNTSAGSHGKGSNRGVVAASRSGETTGAASELSPSVHVYEGKVPKSPRGVGAKSLKGYARRKSLGMEVVHLICEEPEKLADGSPPLDELEKLADKLRSCGAFLLFRQPCGEERKYLKQGYFCQEWRLCPLCASRRAGRFMKEWLGKTLTAIKQNPRLVPVMATCTVANSSSLSTGLDRLKTCLAAYSKHVERCRGKSANRGESGRIWGTVGAVEVKRGSGENLWHPHYHGIWLVEGRADWSKLRSEWVRTSQGQSENIRFSELHAFKRPMTPGDRRRQLFLDLGEVFKYSVKFNDLTPADRLYAALVLKGKPSLRKTGGLRKLEVDDEFVEALPRWSEIDYWEWCYRWLRGEYLHWKQATGDGDESYGYVVENSCRLHRKET